MKKLILALSLVMLMGLPAMGAPDYNVCFSKLDADYDGLLTKEEFQAAFSGGDMTVFETADADKDGAVSHEEWEEYKASQGWEDDDAHG